MAPALIAALPAIATVVSGAINAISQGRQNKKTNEANLKLARYQYEMNSPANQMAQYAKAGLNPNLIYGSGSGAAAKYEAPTVDYRRPSVFENLPSAIAQYQDVSLKQQQIEAMSAQTQSIKAKTILDNLRTMKMTEDSKFYRQSAEMTYKKLYHEAFIKDWQHATASSLPEKVSTQIEYQQKMITNQQLDNIYKRNRNTFAAMGIREGDHIAFRLLLKSLIAAGIPLDSILGAK